jgi:hypothetical protein
MLIHIYNNTQKGPYVVVVIVWQLDLLSMGYLTVLYYQWDTQQSYIINGILNSLILSMGYLTVLYYQWDVNRSSYNLL